jgi:hypothetical protein
MMVVPFQITTGQYLLVDRKLHMEQYDFSIYRFYLWWNGGSLCQHLLRHKYKDEVLQGKLVVKK